MWKTLQYFFRFAYDEPVVIYNIDNDEFRKFTARKKMLEDWSTTPVTLNSANTYSYTRVSIFNILLTLLAIFFRFYQVPSTFGEYLERHLKPQNLDTLGNETLYLFGDIDQKIWKPLLEKYRIPKWSLPGHSPALSFGIAGAGNWFECTIRFFGAACRWHAKFRNRRTVSLSWACLGWGNLWFEEMVSLSVRRSSSVWARPHDFGVVSFDCTRKNQVT